MRRKNILNYMKNIILPCLLYSSLIGIICGFVIFFFKYLVSLIFKYSYNFYAFLHKNILSLFIGLIIVSILSLISYFIYKKFKTTRGGGIPTSIGILRGLFSFKWIPTFFGTFISSLITFFVGIPLGNEGPSVMLGTSLGRGLTSFSKKNKAWDRYIMTGGACSSFAVSTSAPLSGIFFALEEAHQRFSPMIIMASCCSVMMSTLISEVLSSITGISISFLPNLIVNKMEIKYIWVSLILGLAIGLFACLFSRLYNFSHVIKKKTKIHKLIKFYIIFLITFIVGYFSFDFISNGHNLLESITNGTYLPIYILFLILIFRSFMILFSNNEGITGGLFVPTLTLGGIISSIIAILLIKCNLIPSEYYAALICIGIACSIGGMIKTPITGIIFALEALNSYVNISFVFIAVTISYLVTEIFKVKSFNESVIENRLEIEHAGKKCIIVDTILEVKDNSFVVGKTIRDIFWPNNFFVLSLIHNKNDSQIDSDGEKNIHALDKLHVRFSTYDLEETKIELFNLIGEQEINVN